jgi:FkbM family methyltransferase
VDPWFLSRLTKYIGPLNTLRVIASRLRGRPVGNIYTVRASGIKAPLHFRLYSSDSSVFAAIFRRHEYATIREQKNVELIVDCGANVGYSSIYFLTTFPHSRVIAVEPDPANFAMLERNLAAYTDRCVVNRSAIWSHPALLVMDEQPFRDGREWSQHVRECLPGENGFLATDIGTILRQSGAQRISILKIDIEGAESEVFARNYDSWINRVDTIVIELHDDECRERFRTAIAGVPFVVNESGELTVCRRRGGA